MLHVSPIRAKLGYQQVCISHRELASFINQHVHFSFIARFSIAQRCATFECALSQMYNFLRCIETTLNRVSSLRISSGFIIMYFPLQIYYN